METPPELPLAPSPTPAAPVAVVSTAAAAVVTVSSKSTFIADSEEKCELASPKEEAMPISNAAPCTDTSDPSPAEEADAEVCKEPSSVASSDIQVTASTNLINEMNGVSEKVTAAESVVDVAQMEVAPLTVELETPEASPAEVESMPSSSALHTAPSPPPTPPPTPPPPSPPISVAAAAAVTTTTPSPPPLPSPSALPVVQGDLEGEESTRTTLNEEVKDTEKKEETEADGQLEESMEAQSLNLSKSPVPGKHLAPWLCAVNWRMKERHPWGGSSIRCFHFYLPKKTPTLILLHDHYCDCKMLIFVCKDKKNPHNCS